MGKIIITPPFWWNEWSICFYIIVVITLLILLLNFQKRKEEKKNKEKIDKMKADQEKEAYDSKINFFTNIAHEIRTPVSLIIGPLEQITANSHSLPEDIVSDLTIIDRNSQRLLSLVNQLLDFRKIERETIRISLSDQNIYEFLLAIHDRFKSFIEHKSIKFIYSYNDKNFRTGIDVENLTKVVSNLLNNASKYTKDYIELNLHVDTAADKYSISVIDNGMGIPENERENIFKPFYQISGSDKSGTGIGLYLVKSIIDACAGKITIESEMGKGLTFSVELPIIHKIDSDKEETVESAVSIEKEKTDLENVYSYNQESLLEDKPTLLIVEDNLDMQYFLHKNFTASYHVLLANNGLEGIKMLEKNEVDIIISDIMMREMDGIEFCQRVKISILWNHIPVILLTAKTNIVSKIEALEIGADAYVEKPFSMSYLSAQINNLLESRKSLLKRFTETPFTSLKSIAGNKADEEFLTKLHDIIEKNISNVDFSVEQLAEELCISSSGLFAKIKNLAGITPNKLLLIVRLRKATELLAENKYRVNEVCYMTGFNSPSYFAKCFQKQYGVLPKDFNESRQ
ncbi:signal transduction histidine kinase [Dysgonomonas alginatilytica]|uniref:histidine kinase n=1 Tax=Dysgonomonas alginatilytica TaxID=1605892 RepID=A0A2V3PUI4_9BACT|nr:ATP-binding protein [Dysgonomonas alginatilytica]PXV67971.1 signal transduction histidine kinase [Dysgonomonas alginatilytica]